MNQRGIILILLAILFAGGTVYVANSWLNSQRSALNRMKPEPTHVEAPENQVLVAQANLPTGMFLRPENLRWQAWPKASLAKSYILKAGSSAAAKKQIEAFAGAVVRRGIAMGEPITDGRVVKPGERGFLAAVLHPDMRAISVSVSATTATAGFVFPGDRVDLLLTHTVKQGKSARRASETVLTNMKVLAIDQRTDDQNSKPSVAKTVTLEVTPKQVEMINVARTLGRLSLSLRALPQDDRLPILTAADDKESGERVTVVANDSPDILEKLEEPIEPGRGRSYTWDSEASRLLNSSFGPRVTILRGRSETVKSVKTGEEDTGDATAPADTGTEDGGDAAGNDAAADPAE